MTPPTAPRALVLVGFMGAGKTTVGRALAERLGWCFLDADAELERVGGRPIADYFAAGEETDFREMEARVVSELASRSGSFVLATGGGWGADPRRVRSLPDGVAAVWLRVSPEVAVRRASREGPFRPLLAVGDPVQAARGLLTAREAGYAAAEISIETDHREPGRIVEEILHAAGLTPEPSLDS
ncbi:MAG: shikimate kinase [Longimicrobiales bacterium]|nr:shikimate kinase [Longimicrobiales bacterium]